MADVFFYVPQEKQDDIVECGLKLSEWKVRDQELPFGVLKKPCIITSLHPKDNEQFKNSMYSCLKLNVSPDSCYVADSDLYKLSMKENFKKYYLNSMVLLKDYKFGSYRSPECLVFSTILPEDISALGKGLNAPLLFESSEALYINNILFKYNEKFEDFNQVLLYSFCVLKEKNGDMTRFDTTDNKVSVFINNKDKSVITVEIPQIEKYTLFDDI